MPYKVGKREVYREGENRRNFPVKTIPTDQVQNYKELRTGLKKHGKKFEDPEFNPSTSDLIGNVDLLKGDEYPKWDKQFHWKRPKDIDASVVFSQLDKRGCRFDISQGGLGDCYLLTALGLVTSNERMTNFIIPLNNNDDEYAGIFHFRFWIRGYFFDILVDDRLPYVDLFGNGKLEPAFTKLAGKDMWPPLFEKAYAKLYGSYAAIEGGIIADALEDVTGGFIEAVKLDTPDQDPIQYGRFVNHELFGVFAGFGTPETAVEGLQDGHAYGVVDTARIKNNKGEIIELLRLRNPWGNTEWTGEWSDKSPLWNTVPAADKAKLNLDKDEGEFWMTLKRACEPEVFTRAYFCYWLRDLETAEVGLGEGKTWQWRNIHGTWEGDGTGDMKNWIAIAKKPQYKIDISHKEGKPGSVLLVSLLYKDFIKRKDNVPTINLRVYQIADEVLRKEEPPFSADDFKKGKLKQVELGKVAKFAKAREYCTGALLPTGSYVVIPYAAPGEKGDFLLRLIGEL